jgi:hypothetical protein
VEDTAESTLALVYQVVLAVAVEVLVMVELVEIHIDLTKENQIHLLTLEEPQTELLLEAVALVLVQEAMA